MDRLLEVEQIALNQTHVQINLLEKYLADYKNLQEKLSSLPNEIQYNIMVPFGTVGFMPGRMVHTNEVKILLGDDWFLETSTKHACDIVQRRNANLEKQIDELKEQNKLIESRISFTSQLTESYTEEKDIIEIKEEYNEEAETLWKEKHKENLKKYYENSAVEKIKNVEDLPIDFWNKYDEEPDEVNEAKDSKLKRKVSFCDDIKKRPENQIVNSCGHGDIDLKSKTIFFKHTNNVQMTGKKLTNELKHYTPADIYTNFEHHPKSILKKPSSYEDLKTSTCNNKRKELIFDSDVAQPISNIKVDSIDKRVIKNNNLETPCSNIVIERDPQSQANQIPTLPIAEKVSKFKASRLKP